MCRTRTEIHLFHLQVWHLLEFNYLGVPVPKAFATLSERETLYYHGAGGRETGDTGMARLTTHLKNSKDSKMVIIIK